MGIEHLISGGLATLVHPLTKLLTNRQQNKHAERMEEIGIKELAAEAKIKVTQASLAGWRATYAAPSVTHLLPDGVKLPSWAGALLAVAAFATLIMRPVIVFGCLAVWAFQPNDLTAAHFGVIALGWTFGYHASETGGGLPEPAALKALTPPT